MKKIIIITAMQEEANHIIKLYSLNFVKKFLNINIYENDKIVLALSGIGKIQVSIATTYLFENYDIEKLINIGISGNLRGKNVAIGDIFIVNKVFQHDMYLPIEIPNLGYAKDAIEINNKININDNFNFKIYNNSYCLTGDQFIDDEKIVNQLYNKYSADVVDMEAFAVCSVAREYNKLDDCIIIKAISDGASNDAKESCLNNLDFAMQNSIEVLKQIMPIYL